VRNRSAYTIFGMENRNKIANKIQSNDFGEVTKQLAAEWKAISPKEKKKYEEQAAKDKERYLIELHNFMLKGNSHLLIEDPNKYLKQLKESSGKIELVEKMLPVLKQNGHKVLLFSQMTRMLDILEDYLEYSSYEYCRIDGSVKQKDREELIERFNTDPNIFCFLLSTRAGGLGINLTAADTVIIYDSDWNPQADLQAQDRCHRIGQTKPVCVFRLITANSIESRILKRANKKLKLERLVMHKGRFKGQNNKLITEDDILEILTFDEKLHTEKVISNDELTQVLDRDTCFKMFDNSLRVSKLSNDGKLKEKQVDNNDEENKGYQFIEEKPDEF